MQEKGERIMSDFFQSRNINGRKTDSRGRRKTGREINLRNGKLQFGENFVLMLD